MCTRRTWWRRLATGLAIGTICTASFSGIFDAAAAEKRSSGAVVRTADGLVRGAVTDGSRVFQGIPYAKPPVDELRWKPPQPVPAWPGVRDATEPGPACAQLDGEVPGGSRSEDCLYLDVTTPTGGSTTPGGVAKPVVVWVHGGGFFMGRGSNYGAQRLAERGDVVVVTVNYRLGVFGFFGYPGLPGSGTYGLQDQQAALRWVRQNIDEFGGDAGNVTLAGQSAGALSTCAQLTSPGGTGLFDKAVMQSGSCELRWWDNFDYRGQQAASFYQPVSAVRERGRHTGKGLGCSDTECLRGLSVEQLLKVHQAFIQPAYGTSVLPMHPAKAVRAGLFHRVPVISGQTKNETTPWAAAYDKGQPMSDQTYRAVLADTFGADEAKVRAEYPRSDYDNAAEAWAAITTDRAWACSQFATSRQLAQHVPVHQFEFADPDPPVQGPQSPEIDFGAFHASDLWSFFDLAGHQPAFTPAQQRLSEQMIDYWASFAYDSDPNGPELPAWPRFEDGAKVPYVQSLAPAGHGGVGAVDLAKEHHCGFWSTLQ